MKAPTLQNKVALVTGGGAGIGRAISLALATQGYRVAVMDIAATSAEETAALAEKAVGKMDSREGIKALALTTDVSDYDAVKGALARVRTELGDPLVVVSNAGIAGEPSLFRNETKEHWKRQFEVHVDGAYHCIRESLDGMLDAGWGRIVCISSVAARLGWRGGASYAAAKAALLGLVRSLALEVASKGVTVNAVLPGLIETAMAREALVKVRDRIEGAIPMKRVGQPQDIAAAVAYLCSEEAGYVTGQCLSPNGGMWAS